VFYLWNPTLKKELQKGYNAAAFSRAMNEEHKMTAEKRRPIGVASLQFQLRNPFKFKRLLEKLNMKTVHIHVKKSSRIIKPVKDDLGLIILRGL
jgi:hypothetical protein